MYIGSVSSGDAAPLYRTFTNVDIADTALQKPLLQRAVDQNLTVREVGSPDDPSLLRVGGFPAARTLIRFQVPEYLRDSATIIRATLELVPDAPMLGIPGDSARIDARTVAGDFGAKSVVDPTRVASTWIHPGSDTVRIDMANLVALWQGTDNTGPTAVRLELGQEFASFLAPNLRSTRTPNGGPRLRITYRTPYGVRAF
jgi:hypothetical protein